MLPASLLPPLPNVGHNRFLPRDLPHEDADRALVLDAALSDDGPGALAQISGDDVPAYFAMRISPHEIALRDLLAIARLRGVTPLELVVVGMPPASIELGWELSDIVASRLDEMIASAAAVLYQWGIAVEPRGKAVEVAGHLGGNSPERETRDA